MTNLSKHLRNTLFLACIALAQLATAQTASNSPAFEVTTVKPSDPDSRGSNFNLNRDHFSTQNIDLLSIIKFAYNLNMGSSDQVADAPGWISTAKFDINAKYEDALADHLKNMSFEDQMKIVRPMIQALLAERFHLQLHHETRELRVDLLEVTKTGSKLKVPPEHRDEKSWEGLHGSSGQIEGRRATVAMFVSVLSHQPEVGNRLVLDKTGLEGHYDFDVQWSPLGSDQPGPSLFTAMEEQMGLRIESAKAPVDVLVIDSVQQPSQN